MASPTLHPLASEDEIKSLYLGESLQHVPVPAAVIDVGVAKRNCDLMLDTVEELAKQGMNVGFRAHVKSHKTTQLTRLQVGEKTKDVKLIVSTVVEAEQLVPYLLECRRNKRSVNILYGLPLPPSQIRKLAKVGLTLGPGSIAVMIDHEDQLTTLKEFKEESGFPAQVFIKLDTGYHRAGIPPGPDLPLQSLLRALQVLEENSQTHLLGFYSHSGQSYHSNSARDITGMLLDECRESLPALRRASSTFPSRRFVLSVGATPTATSIQNFLRPTPSPSNPLFAQSNDLTDQIQQFKDLTDQIGRFGSLELHAGVYPLLDIQQLETHARSSESLSYKDIALTILTEVSSVYNKRNPPEALMAAGSLALGREPCGRYPGYGVVTDWGMVEPSSAGEGSGIMRPSDIVIDRISQEHGILARQPEVRPPHDLEVGQREAQPPLNLKVGQKIRIWPNHACVAGAGHGWYFIVDPAKKDRNEIVDIWVRWRGW